MLLTHNSVILVISQLSFHYSFSFSTNVLTCGVHVFKVKRLWVIQKRSINNMYYCYYYYHNYWKCGEKKQKQKQLNLTCYVQYVYMWYSIIRETPLTNVQYSDSEICPIPLKSVLMFLYSLIKLSVCNSEEALHKNSSLFFRSMYKWQIETLNP